jgi:hypothetical protein
MAVQSGELWIWMFCPHKNGGGMEEENLANGQNSVE